MHALSPGWGWGFPGPVTSALDCWCRRPWGTPLPSSTSRCEKRRSTTCRPMYEPRPVTDPVLPCKYFALFARGEVYSTPHDGRNRNWGPGMDYDARALRLVPVWPERPTIVHIEALLILVGLMSPDALVLG
ncbi:uncharacterized protein BO80DRAFT_446383 [Aspergillus ibericus CBS 121593]|uniref:Uncharacterized protein n=1 Tax=Aspergillus ibericus CBS 121593 TaxID=1448316 RepID=A0A395GV78_9EURO|nr:hypothetical protein BO80DRAFT_446383 [Aspergillus ibericus CBS 121593]RAK99405.1 hypothetical protein BO80DRAFT_446383 [Aspergillus ibericus CBS 121593]